jgi:hypothetical protein
MSNSSFATRVRTFCVCSTLDWANKSVVGLLGLLVLRAILHACNLDCHVCDVCKGMHGRELCKSVPRSAITKVEMALQGLSFHLLT